MQETTLLGYIDGLFGYAMVLTRNPAEADDLVQETYLRALKAKISLRAISNVKGWLFTILRNIWLNDLRHERAGPKIAELEPDQTLADVSVATSGDPHDLYVTTIERDQVRAAIQQLPVEFREIVILREYEELSYQEIASMLKCPIGTVMSRLARARSKLRDLLSISWQPRPTVEDRPARDAP
jgi:RNA polymerase sigma-70 factor (ECF subfamily)